MKRKIGILLIVFGIFYGLTFAYNDFSFHGQVNAMNSEANRIDMQMEYMKDEDVEESVIKKIRTDYKEKVISFEQTNTVDASLNNLHKQYEVKTITLENEMRDQPVSIPEKVYTVDVVMEDTNAPIIEGKDISVAEGGEFDIAVLEIKAYDKVDGDLQHDIVENPVDTSKTGEYKVVVEAEDANELRTRKTFTVRVESSSNETQSQNQGQTQQTTPTQYGSNYTPLPALDRSNLNIRGWRIVANDSRVSDATLRAYMNEIQNLPPQYNTSHFHTVYIDMTLSYPYLGMAYGDGRIVLNGSAYYPTLILHEATHTYDYARGFANDPRLVEIFHAEKNNIPAKFSGNMRDDPYEWVANLVVYYYYDPGTLRARAPRSYDYVVNVILR